MQWPFRHNNSDNDGKDCKENKKNISSNTGTNGMNNDDTGRSSGVMLLFNIPIRIKRGAG